MAPTCNLYASQVHTEFFFQDFPAYWAENAEHPAFDHDFFDDHAEPWARWCALHTNYCKRMQECLEQSVRKDAWTVTVSELKRKRQLIVDQLRLGNIDILSSEGSSRGFFQKQAEEVRCDVCKHAYVLLVAPHPCTLIFVVSMM